MLVEAPEFLGDLRFELLDILFVVLLDADPVDPGGGLGVDGSSTGTPASSASNASSLNVSIVVSMRYVFSGGQNVSTGWNAFCWRYASRR